MLTPEQKAKLEELSKRLGTLYEKKISGELDDLPISKRGMMEYRIKHGLPPDAPLPHVITQPLLNSEAPESSSPSNQNDVLREELWTGLKQAATLSGAIKEIIRQRETAKGKTSGDQGGQEMIQQNKFQHNWYTQGIDTETRGTLPPSTGGTFVYLGEP